MTNTWQDIGTSDVIMVIGGNPAENHPMGFKHVLKAMENYYGNTGPTGNGAKLIVVDPRFTRTSAKASRYNGKLMYSRLRSGTDIPFVNGMIRYTIANQRYNEKYVLSYSNAGFLINEGFKKPGDLGQNGVYSDLTITNPATPLGDFGTYTKAHWGYCTWPSQVVSAGGETAQALNLGAPGPFMIGNTGTSKQWLSWVRPGDTFTGLGGGGVPPTLTVATVDSDTQITCVEVGTGVEIGPSTTYTVNINAARALMGVNIATDFWDASGNCICGACSVTNTSLSLDSGAGADYIGNFRTHLASCGLVHAFPTIDDDPPQKTAWEHMLDHYVRYDAATVCNITGADTAVYADICDLYTQSGADGKAACILYAMGTTQHTVGTQNIRAYSTLQILLGNMGLSGGGVNAQRGESNVQGSTDHCLLFHILPGYITQPTATAGDAVFDSVPGTTGHPTDPPSYCKRGTPYKGHQGELNWWGFWGGQSNFKRYMVSLMKCYWWDWMGGSNTGVPATDDPTLPPADTQGANSPQRLQYIYDWIPKLPGNCSHIELFEQMHAGEITGLLCFGQNPAVAGPNCTKEREALQNLDFLVVSELWETETAAVWQYNKYGNKLTPAQMASVPVETFLLPAACHLEKEGSVTNSSRWAQFRYKAVEPPGNNQVGTDSIPLGAKHETWIINALYEEINLACTTYPRDNPIKNLTMGIAWYNGRCGEPLDPWAVYADPTADFLDREINGMNASVSPSPPACSQVGSFTSLQNDGTTSAGNWLYTNMYDATGNKSKKRDNVQPGVLGDRAPIFKNWAWDWPVNRRIIYNGASMVPCGFGGVTATPWDSDHAVISHNPFPTANWDRVNYDVEDGVGEPHTWAGHAERTPFIMKPEGHCRLHGHGMADGPYPEHYEPLDTLFYGRGNPMGHAQVCNPAITIYEPTKIGRPGNGYNIVATTYRCTEHWQAGAQTRHLPWLAEMWPDVTVEMSPRLANTRGVKTGDAVRITTERGTMLAYAQVTNRFEDYQIWDHVGERYYKIFHVGIFWHFGYKGIATGHSANVLTAHVGDANTRIPEYKAFLCKINKYSDGVNA